MAKEEEITEMLDVTEITERLPTHVTSRPPEITILPFTGRPFKKIRVWTPYVKFIIDFID